MYQVNPESVFHELLSQNKPQAVAEISGNSLHPDLYGVARFFATPYDGILIAIEVSGLPNSTTAPNFLGMHIHETGDCTPPFDRTGNHYNPHNQPHPHHAGDLPPLLNNQGYSFTVFYNGYLTIEEIAGRSLIIHSQEDDFTTQPSGNSGDKIGCGVIRNTFPSRNS